jgi:hypothetical protein
MVPDDEKATPSNLCNSLARLKPQTDKLYSWFENEELRLI